MPSSVDREFLAGQLAHAFLAGLLDVEPMVERGARMLGKRWRWLRPLVVRVHQASEHTPARHFELSWFIRNDQGFQRACRKYEVRAVNLIIEPAPMRPVPPAGRWSVPAIHTAGELAEWLQITSRQLDWFSDARSFEAKLLSPRARHYHYRLLQKRFGSVRVIEAPKSRLKSLQRQVLDQILSEIPPHAAAHGFRRGHSTRSFAASHTGKEVVLRVDLKDFFPSVRRTRVASVFRAVGYPEPVADQLASLCTNTAPPGVWEESTLELAVARQLMALYGRPHLPQGAPTSPALANLCTYRLDCRLKGLARCAAADYSRYADDLAFSGDREFARGVRRFAAHVAVIVAEEGFVVHHHKTRVMRQSTRQCLAGVVVNQHPGIRRCEYDELKAILFNCCRFGWATQQGGQSDFRAYLNGKVAYVEMLNPQRGQKLRHVFDQIDWSSDQLPNR